MGNNNLDNKENLGHGIKGETGSKAGNMKNDKNKMNDKADDTKDLYEDYN